MPFLYIIINNINFFVGYPNRLIKVVSDFMQFITCKCSGIDWYNMSSVIYSNHIQHLLNFQL